MKFNSWLLDKKIKGLNVSLELSIEEYWEFANSILKKNEYQRKKVKASGKIYQLLGRDLKSGSIMPPIILAVSGEIDEHATTIVEKCLKSNDMDGKSKKDLKKFVGRAIEKGHILILDGLQRTYTIEECIKSLKRKPKGKQDIDDFYNTKIRAEIYVGLSKLGILYRMITLNTGQTPMTLRHQIEMLYQGYLDNDLMKALGIKLVREVEGKTPRNIGEYKYSDVADMYYSFTVCSPNSYSKQTISTILKEHEFLEGFQPENTVDFNKLIEVYHDFVIKVDELFSDWSLSEETASDLGGPPLGKNVGSIGRKVQVMAGFGAACSKLIKLGQYKGIDEIDDSAISLLEIGMEEQFDEGPLEWLIECLDEIRAGAKKVGESQRAYFNLFFKHLFNKDHESFLKLSDAMVSARDAYDASY